MEQMGIFDILEESKQKEETEQLFDLGNLVKIRKANANLDVEDYYYQKEFENKKGHVMEKSQTKKGDYCYTVNFGNNRKGLFYGYEMILI